MPRQSSKQDIKKFTATYDELAEQLFRYCCFKLSNQESALDIVQETFARAWQQVQGGKKIDNMKSFLFKVANNLIIDQYRKKKSLSLEILQEDGFDPAIREDVKTILKAELNAVLSYINRLTRTYKDVILLRYIGDFSPQEIALILDETENTISVRINRALKKIKQMMDPH